MCSSIIVVQAPNLHGCRFLCEFFVRIFGADGIEVINFMLSERTSINTPVNPFPETPPLSTNTVIGVPINAGS